MYIKQVLQNTRTFYRFYNLQWVASENTQTPNFQIFPGQMGMPIPDEMGCGKKNRKGGGPPLSIFFWKFYLKTYLITVDFYLCRTNSMRVNDCI